MKKNALRRFLGAALAACLSLCFLQAEEPVPMVDARQEGFFRNGNISERIAWRDTAGNLINAHDGGVIYADGTYYWYGLALRPGPVTRGTNGGEKTETGVVMYSSKNLYRWAYEGVILECSSDPNSPLRSPMRFERPKIVYNDRTKKFVMWVHFVGYPGDHGVTPGLGEAGVASCDRVNGKYEFHGTTRPLDNDGIVRDSTLYKDDDGSAYFIYDREFKLPEGKKERVLHVVKLSDDYLTWTNTFYKIQNAAGREAPTILKRNGYYYLITSALTGWKPNPAKYFRSRSLLGPYDNMGDPCIGEGAKTTYDSQSTYAFNVDGVEGLSIVMLERHYPKSIMESSYIWLPARFTPDNRLGLPYLETWKWEDWDKARLLENANAGEARPTSVEKSH